MSEEVKKKKLTKEQKKDLKLKEKFKEIDKKFKRVDKLYKLSTEFEELKEALLKEVVMFYRSGYFNISFAITAIALFYSIYRELNN